MLGIFRGSDAYLGNAFLHLRAGIQCTWSGLIVVVDDVDVHTFTTIAALTSPVVDDVVAHVHTFVSLSTRTRTETGRTALIVGYQVVVVRSTAAAPVAAITVGTLRVSGILQTL